MERCHVRALAQPCHLAYRSHGTSTTAGLAGSGRSQSRRRRPRCLPWRHDGMKSRFVMFAALMIAAAALATAVSHLHTGTHRHMVRAALPTMLASYLGVFEHGSPPGYGPVATFAKAADRQPDLVGYYSGWGGPVQ